MPSLADFEPAVDELSKETLAETTLALIAEMVEQICAAPWETLSDREKAQLLIICVSELTRSGTASG